MIKKRNLDNALVQWIMTQTGLGPGIGKLKYVAKATATASQYRSTLEENGVETADLFTTLKDAYAATVTNRNDVMLVAPGAYDEAATLDWTKDNLHMIGLGGPNQQSDYSEANTAIYTDTAAVDYTIHLTGDHCIMKNIHIGNAGANAGNFGPLYVNGYGNYFERLGLVGNMTSQQLADDDCASLHIGTTAHNCHWIDCAIGEDCWGLRTAAYSGQVSFIGSQPNGGYFESCRFRSASAVATVAMITAYKGAAGSTHIGRGWFWKNCVFNNFDQSSTVGTNCNEVFSLQDATGSWPMMLHNCSAYGYDRWTDQTAYVLKGTMPVADDGGGLDIRLDQTVAGGS